MCIDLSPDPSVTLYDEMLKRTEWPQTLNLHDTFGQPSQVVDLFDAQWFEGLPAGVLAVKTDQFLD